MPATAKTSSRSVTASSTGAGTLPAMLLAAAARHDGAAITTAGSPAVVTYLELGVVVREIAAGLADLGVQPGDRVSIIGNTRAEWTLADLGALCAAAVVAPIYHTNSAEECAYVLTHAGTRVLFCEDAQQVAKIEGIRGRCPALEHLVVLDGEAPGALTLRALRERGARAGDGVAAARTAGVRPDDLATLVYTSGTTGTPKGCMLTHANVTATMAMYRERLRLDASPPTIFVFLPLAHVLARLTQFVALDVGGTLAFWRGNPAQLREDLAATQPTHVPAVPRIYEKVQRAILDGLEHEERGRRELFRWAVREGRGMQAARRAGTAPAPLQRVRHAAADRLVLRRVREVFGGRLEQALVGAAPMGTGVLEFFDACGVEILEGYGLTESCAAATMNLPGRPVFGSVGPALGGAEVALAPEGEVLLRGPHVFAGYYRDEEATRKALGEGGWLRTGDLGALDGAGNLTITGREKDLIITSSGKNIAPAALEGALRATRWISEAVVFGDRRPYLVALLTLDSAELSALAALTGAPAEAAAMAGDPRVHAVLARDVDAVNARFARIEQIKRFAILEHDLSQEAGELTPTLKTKRALLCDRYADRFAALYEA